MVVKTAVRTFAVRALVGAAVLAGAPGVASAQPFFRAWGGYYPAAPAPFYEDDYDGGPYERPYYAPRYRPGSAPVGPREIAQAAASAGFRLIGRPRSTGRAFVATGEDRAGRRHQLVFDAADGHVVDDRLLSGAARTGALVKAPPPPKPPSEARPVKATPEAPVSVPAKIEPAAPVPVLGPAAAPPAAAVAPETPAPVESKLSAPPIVQPSPVASPAPVVQPAPKKIAPPDDGTRVRVDKDPLALPPEKPVAAEAPHAETAPVVPPVQADGSGTK